MLIKGFLKVKCQKQSINIYTNLTQLTVQPTITQPFVNMCDRSNAVNRNDVCVLWRGLFHRFYVYKWSLWVRKIHPVYAHS